MDTAQPSSLRWFRPWGWIYLPVHPLGFLVLIAALAFAGQVFVWSDRHSHSIADTLYHWYPFAAPTFLGLMWIASRTCGSGGGTR